MTVTPRRRALARALLIAAVPAARQQAQALVVAAFAAPFDGRHLQPLRDVARDWADRHGLDEHWCVERLVSVLCNLRQSYKAADDRRIFDPLFRYRISWLTVGDSESDGLPNYAKATHDAFAAWRQWSPDKLATADKKARADVLGRALRALPLEADPTEMTREAFLKIAGEHYDVRAKDLRALGIPLVGKQAPELPQHAEWFVRKQVGGESYEAIAATGPRREWQTVQDAVGRFAETIDLPRPTRKAVHKK